VPRDCKYIARVKAEPADFAGLDKASKRFADGSDRYIQPGYMAFHFERLGPLTKFLNYVVDCGLQLVLSDDDQGDLGKSVGEEKAESTITSTRPGKMDLERIEKKLREAGFFLNQMRDREGRAFGDKEPFDFYLSACLGAARSVDYRLRHEQPNTYPTWRGTWDATLTSAEQQLIKFMVDDRNVEVHESGSTRGVKTEEIKIAGSYSDKSGTLEVSGGIPGMPSHAHIIKPSYFFTIDGVDRKATEACAEYLALLERMLAEFKAAHP
jgi:hypothetical protein